MSRQIPHSPSLQADDAVDLSLGTPPSAPSEKSVSLSELFLAPLSRAGRNPI